MNNRDLFLITFASAMFILMVGHHAAIAGTEKNSYRPVHSYVRVSTEDSSHPQLFVKMLKKQIVAALVKDGQMQSGYPKPCQFEGPYDKPHFCIDDTSASLDTIGPFLLNKEGYHLEFRIIKFLSLMPYHVQIYLVPEHSEAFRG